MKTESETDLSLPQQKLEILKTHSLVTIIMQVLEGMILSGQLKPGDWINEKALGEQHAVSRGRVREACRRLEHAGLVEIIVNHGVFVRTIEAKDALDMAEVRACLFHFAGSVLSQQIQDETIDQLALMVQQMEDFAKVGNIDAYTALNIEFHKLILKSTGNQCLVNMCEAIDKNLYLFRRKSFHSIENVSQSLKGHRRIIEALRARDPDNAAKVFEEHAISGKNRILESIGSIPAATKRRVS